MTASVLKRARSWAIRSLRRGLRLVLGPASPLRRALPAPVKSHLRTVRRHLPVRLVRVVDSSTGNRPAKPVDQALLAAGSQRPLPPTEPIRVWVAPANFAGQGKAWADALSAHVPGVGARSMAVTGVIRFAVDQEVHSDVYRDVGWQAVQEQHVTSNYTHVLIEAERPIFGTRYGSTCEIELDRLRSAGLTVGLISHGSDLRLPSRHAQMFEHSPFDDPHDKTTKILQARAEQNARILNEFDGPVFVSTPDLLDYAPQATWCPTVVDPGQWTSDWPVLARPVPRVVHIPSNGRLKGSEFIDETMSTLAAEGLVEYRRLTEVTREDIRREYAQADIVIDQLVMGLYGVASIEALAAGRIVVAFLGDVVRERVRATVGVDVPIREATVETLEQVIRDIVADPEASRTYAEAGPTYVAQVHDGRLSAQVLASFTGCVPESEMPAELAGPDPAPAEPAPATKPVPDLSSRVRLFVGPANFAGQGTAWARAAQRYLPDVSARAMATAQPTLRFETDYQIESSVFSDAQWCRQQLGYLREFYTHVLIEAMRPVTGYQRGVRASDEIPDLLAAGLSVALIAHGTDVRIPSVHRATTPWSPFDERWDGVPSVPVLEERTQRNVDSMGAFDGPCFVSTPDLIDYVPHATWCPVVVDPDRWASPDGPGQGEGPPVVVHVPSHSLLKGSALIDPAVTELAATGIVEYRRRTGVPPAQMPQLYREADIVLDQFALGSYGVAACEAMAAGQVVVGHVTEQVRGRVREATGLELPIVEATPDQIGQVLTDLAADRDRVRALGAAGVEFVRVVHDGRRSSEVLAGWLLAAGQ